MGQQAESIGIALKMSNIFPEMWANFLLQANPWTFCEECLHSLFATMPEGRITHVVCITSCLYDGSNLFKERTTQLWVYFDESSCNVIT